MSQNDDKTMLDPGAGPSKDGVKMKLGPYETTELLGRGGMAVVYKGTQQSLGRIVAIKVLPKEFSRDRQFVGRFHREAESVARLNHPNIIQIIDKGEDGGTCYFVMEYVKGQSLAAKLADKGVNLKELIEIGIQVCSALHFAHEQGVVHRDIKPANILLDETTGVAKVADFGIAQLAEKSTAIGTLTGDHMAMGTLDYMAPEQKRDAKNVDRRADVYSVGVMLYEMSTGRVPMGIFDPPSRINKDIPKDFDVIVMKCLRDKPAERYQTCQELSNALLTLPQNPSTMVRMITSVKSGVTNIGTQIGRRNPRYIAAVLFLVAGLGVGSVAVWKKDWLKPNPNGNTSGNGNTGNNGNGNTGGNGNGTATRPPDETAAQAAEKALAKKIKEAGDLADKGDIKAAIDAYALLLPDATGALRQEINDALRDLKEHQEIALAEEFRKKLDEARVDPELATAASVAALQKLLDDANAQKVREAVVFQITTELERTRNASKVNEQAAAARTRAANFREAADKAKTSIDAGDLDAAEKALGLVANLAEGASETEEYGRLARSLEAKRGAVATAEESRRRFDKFMAEAGEAASRGDFTPARLRLADAEALATVVGGDASNLVKAAREDIDRREKNARYSQAILEAKKLETSNPAAAAAGYRAAADIAPSQEEAASANTKAKILEDNAAREASDRLFNEHLEAARKAKETRDWKKVEAEARAALEVRRNNPEALALQAEAVKAMQEKPPDPKRLAFTFKGSFKAGKGGLDSVALDPSGVFYALDHWKGGGKLYTVAKDLSILRETAIPLSYPDRVYVDSKGRIWVSEWGNLSTINLFDATNGTMTRSMAGKGSADGKFNYLVDIAVSPDGERMYGLDSGNFRLQALATADGAFQWKTGTKWSGRGMPDNHFYTARNLAVDPEGRIYTSDATTKTIQRFKPDGTFDGIFKSFTDGAPGPIAWANKRLYVMDVKQNKLIVYAPDGTELGSNPMYGNGDSQVAATTAMVVGPDGKVYIADRGAKIVVLEEAK